mmetsp:Transcript_59438/g.121776  ORF Transcript_59438/g.121776 Transcript_59438/m.121776 type:complete len:136 (-) Transcript_59438:695-1102(-)
MTLETHHPLLPASLPSFSLLFPISVILFPLRKEYSHRRPGPRSNKCMQERKESISNSLEFFSRCAYFTFPEMNGPSPPGPPFSSSSSSTSDSYQHIHHVQCCDQHIRLGNDTSTLIACQTMPNPSSVLPRFSTLS